MKFKEVLLTGFMTLFIGLSGSINAQESIDKKTLQAVIVGHPDSLEAHQAYIKAVGLNNTALIEQYEKWIAQFPDNATIPFAIGAAYTARESSKAKPWLLKAVKLNPKLASAWNLLSQDASRWGDFKAANEYLGKAAEAEPDNPDYAFYYASSFSNLNPGLY